MQALPIRGARFQSDERGTVAVIFGLISLVFLAFGGISIDMSRVYGADTRAGAALDVALLAAGDARNRLDLSDAELQTLAQKSFDANIRGRGNRESEYSNFQLTIEGDVFTGTVDVKVPLAFAGLVSIDEMNFTARAQATFEELDLELGLMLDVTGSMNNTATGSTSSKLAVLKRAVSQDLIGTLIPGNDNDRIRIAYAPYSASVNVGSFADQVRQSGAPSNDNCVVERETNRDSESAPGGGQYFRSVETANQTLTRDQNNNDRYDFYACPDAAVLPLTSSKRELVDTINSYSARGRTAGHLGIAWAWYTISPEWANIWGSGSEPKPYETDKLVKAVVLFTDGEFNAAYDDSDFFGDAESESYNRTAALCNNIRGKDVLVFSIGFGISNGSQAARALEACASPDTDNGGKFYFPTANESELSAAFRRIASQLTRLRLTQ
ncbi:MAG: pilus assembly protein TadG-related protein [Pseudomonadota bacterium]